MKDLRGKVAAVTGAASGIGRALAVALAADGCALALSDVDDSGLEETSRSAARHGGRVTTAHVDVADRAAVHRWADQVVADHGAAHLAINNAGVGLAATIAEMRYEELEWLMGINFWGVVHGTKAFLPHLERAGEGHVVNVSSVFGMIAVPGQAAYNAAKFAVRGFTEALREELELAGSRVSATCVHPGGVRTNIARNSRVGSDRVTMRTHAEMVARFEREARTSPEQAARRIIAGVRRNARRVLIGPDAWIIDRVQRWLPVGYQRLVVGYVRRSGLGM